MFSIDASMNIAQLPHSSYPIFVFLQFWKFNGKAQTIKNFSLRKKINIGAWIEAWVIWENRFVTKKRNPKSILCCRRSYDLWLLVDSRFGGWITFSDPRLILAKHLMKLKNCVWTAIQPESRDAIVAFSYKCKISNWNSIAGKLIWNRFCII